MFWTTYIIQHNLRLLTLNFQFWGGKKRKKGGERAVERVTSGLWESRMAAQFQVRHLLLSAMQAARHTPSPQHSGLNLNTPSNTSWRELLPLSYCDFLLSALCAQPSCMLQAGAADTHLPVSALERRTQQACSNTHIKNVLLFAHFRISKHKQQCMYPPLLSHVCTNTHSQVSVLTLGYSDVQWCSIWLLVKKNKKYRWPSGKFNKSWTNRVMQRDSGR